MNPRNLIILCILCVAIAVTALVVNRRNSAQWQGGNGVGGDSLVFPAFPINDINRVVFESPEHDDVTIFKGDKRWTVASHYDYPADYSGLSTLMKAVKDLKADLTIDVAPEDYGRLGLNPPDATAHAGTRVRLYGKGEAVIAEFILGKDYQGREADPMAPYLSTATGRYLLDSTHQRVVVVKDRLAAAEQSATDWLDHSFLAVSDLKSGELRRNGERLWRIKRTQVGGAWELDFEPPEGEVPDQTRLRNVGDALRYTTFSGIADPATPPADLGFAEGQRFIGETWRGITYTLEIGAKQPMGNYPVRIKVTYTPPPAPPVASDATTPADPDADAARKQAEEAARLAVAEEQARYADWVYILPTYLVDKLTVSKAALTQVPPEAEPGTVKPAVPPERSAIPTAAPKIDEEEFPIDGDTDLGKINAAPITPAAPAAPAAP